MQRLQNSPRDYLAFGYWLSKDSDGDPVGFGTWFNGNAMPERPTMTTWMRPLSSTGTPQESM